MRNIILGALFFLNALAYSQTEKYLGDFNELKVYDRIEVALIKSEENKIIISANNSEDVVVVNKNGILKIRMTLKEIFDGDETTVQVFYKKLDVIDANEGSFISSNSVFEQFEMDLRAQEGGIVKLMVKDLTFLEVKAITGGLVELTGNAKNQNIGLNTGGTYKGKELLTEKTDVVIKAAGEAHVNATKEVKAKVRAGGSVHIYGNPEKVDEDTVLGGKIVHKN